MWQFVFVAAVAGSGILVKRFFRNGGGGDHPVKAVRVSSVSEQTDQSKQWEEENVMEVKRKEEQEAEEDEEEEEESVDIVKPDALITSLGVSDSGVGDSWRSERQHSVVEDEGIFRFSSLDRGEGSGSRSGSKGLLKKAGLKGNVDSVRRRSTSRAEKKLMLEDQRKKGRKFSFCLKRRRTRKKNAFRKCGSCSSQGNSLFSCGVGLGFMYLLTAGKAEINKLIVDIEKTTKVLTNLKSEVCKRKLSHDLQDSSCKDRANMETVGKNKEPLLTSSDSGTKLASPDDPKVLDLSSNCDGECASSILTEEVDLEALEMDKLEAELEYELQKIPNEIDPEYFVEFPNTELSAYALQGPQEPLDMDPNSSQFYGVSPSELDRKLCHVLIKQQESQIAELESNLCLSQMKLREKEAELQTLKAVVGSLRDLSLETASDDEAEDGVVLDDDEEEEEKEMNNYTDSLIYPISVDDGSNKIVVKEQKSLCGVKRVMEFESYADCQVIHNALVSECNF